MTTLYYLYGQITNRQNHRGLADLKVEIWDQDAEQDNLIGDTVTDANGYYHYHIDVVPFLEGLDRRPDLYIIAYHRDAEMGSTKDRVLPDVRPGEYRIDLAVDFAAAAPKVFNSVSGKAASATGDPVAGYEVRAYH
ncbi:MAG: hypothetical protein QNI97_15500, partial [Desulfobacterales bacterium]|nr:hypothetical protein [Desulfobacterales bacterium]